MLPRIAITMGDPAGIGPEICLQLLAEQSVLELCTPIVFGDVGVLERVARGDAPFRRADDGLPTRPYQVVKTDQWSSACRNLRGPAVLDFAAIQAVAVQPGAVNRATGAASLRYIEASIAAALAGEVDAVTTGPVHKEALHAAGTPFPGHTELFAARTDAQRTCMMLTSSELTCSFVTSHVGLREVPGLLSQNRVLDVIELSHAAMQRLRGRSPRLIVCGLNPHAGEYGLFGDREEERLIVPAIQAAREQGIAVDGPLSPDTAFLPQRRRETDCFVCMYHDQGLIPLKALAFEFAVNVTLGLPIVRTSVDHGTACDIAWQGKADVTSLIEAVTLAARLCRR